MFDFYKDKSEKYEDVFILNNKIIKALIKKNLIKMSDLDNYTLPSSKEDIINKIEKLSGSAKLLTDVISKVLNIESYLKANKQNIYINNVIGEDYIVFDNTYFTTNPLSNHIEKLKKNLNKYKNDEILFNKIGYISEKEFEAIKQEIKTEKESKENTFSHLLIESLFIESINKAMDNDASNLRFYYKGQRINALQTINSLSFEKKLNEADISIYNKFSSYIIDLFNDKPIIKEHSNGKYKLQLNTGIANESEEDVKIIDIKISNLNKTVPNVVEKVKLDLKEERNLKKSLDTAFGLFILSSKTNRKESVYSIAQREQENHNNARILLIENDIEREFANITQMTKYQNANEWSKLDFENYNIVIFENVITKEDFDFVLNLATNGKKVIAGMTSNNSIEAFSKIHSLVDNKEILSDNLLGIFHTEKINKVCQNCSNSDKLFKDPNYQDLSMLEYLPKMTKLIKRESNLGCENCYKGYVGLIEVGEYLHNDHILRSSILNGLDLMNLKIEKNSDSWHNIFENSLYLLESQEITTNSIIKNLGYPKK
tara:strand:- start:3330 stop:4958 length:1629 start_codon:yes stop_codon:yes gene_type:complete